MAKSKGKIDNSIQVVCFRIATDEYGIEIHNVQEILRMPKITALPKAAEYIMGVIDLRGKVLPVVDINKRFGILESNLSQYKRAVVINIKGKVIGLAIESVSNVVKVSKDDVELPPPVVKGIAGNYIFGIAKIDEKFVVILDVDKIFSCEEIEEM